MPPCLDFSAEEGYNDNRLGIGYPDRSRHVEEDHRLYRTI